MPRLTTKNILPCDVKMERITRGIRIYKLRKMY